MHQDKATLLDIAEAAMLILSFVGDVSKEEFLEDAKTQSAVLHQLLVLGEAAKRLTPKFRTENPEIQWRLMAGMRDVLIHAYDTVDLDEVWKTANHDVPDLLSKVQPLLPANHG